MTTEHRRASEFVARLLAGRTAEEVTRQMSPRMGDVPRHVTGGSKLTAASIERRWRLLKLGSQARAALYDPQTAGELAAYQANIENFIGTVKVPIGLAGPLRVNGSFAQGDFYVPLATTEAALVASYSRGARLITRCGGCAALLINEAISRAPAFAFDSIVHAGMFVAWALSEVEHFKRCVASSTHHGNLIDMQVSLEGNHVYLNFQFTTGDAAGQNMVTLATQRICTYIIEHSPLKPRHWFLESNLSGDKKASTQSFASVRGRKVTAEAIMPARTVRRMLRTTPAQMVKYYHMSAMGGVLSGTIGVEGDVANGLAAMYIACGQDAACVAESAVGVTRLELTDDASLYASVTLPNLVVGTVGGGTGLPSQNACLQILGLAGPGNASAFAEVCAAVALAGEISISGSLAAGDFADAHQRLARDRREPSLTTNQDEDEALP